MKIPVLESNGYVTRAELDALWNLYAYELELKSVDKLGFERAGNRRTEIYRLIKECLDELMHIRATQEDVGVVIGRFQVHKLHDGHKCILNAALRRHNRLIVLIGVSDHDNTRHNPLPFEFRRDVIIEDYPEALVVPIYDVGSDQVWSQQVDSTIEALCPGTTYRLYGGRDSFIPKYSGKHKATELPTVVLKTGTEMREEISGMRRSTADFRAGIVYAAQHIKEEK